VPLRLCSFIGFIVAFFAFLYAVFTIIMTLLDASPAPEGIQTVITAIFFFAGVQLAFIGLLGEYVTAIHAQVRRGPMVVERERINIPATDQSFTPSMSNQHRD
jgi:Na+/alanine symporter